MERLNIDVNDVFNVCRLDPEIESITLQNKNREEVAVLYLDKISDKTMVVSETNTTDKYFLYIDGVGIFWTYFKKNYK